MKDQCRLGGVITLEFDLALPDIAPQMAHTRPPGLGPANIFVGGFPERTPLLNGAWMRSWISSSDSASEAPRYQSVAAIAGVAFVTFCFPR